ncbi:4'-phosphopantetheinyl transferase sfp [Methanobrevibacter cuticularis]|uniref:4'-phosphopantetheinyl transferase sfp n=1 Tax=Methanobrevibacter cuticularis TaxID=47311 RepID=A0A166CIE1_9EURY|nr:4'-phosphopantetheinyl transferase superfamily protein [Methanobrevibacter cuticularis]KZX14627.1 4'-phosphopantetheinyl transferase sfp [Methanobrevibacter cuticularis]
MLLYYMNIADLDLNQVKDKVSENRWKYSKKYIYQKDKLLSLGGEALLNYLLKKIKIHDPIFINNSLGKPCLKNYPEVHFNISHSEKYVFCGVSYLPIGLDIECIHKIDLSIAKTQFHQKEYEYIINSQNKYEAFFKIWVLKESYLKMTGIGLKSKLNSFFIDIGENNNIKVFKNKNHQNYHSHDNIQKYHNYLKNKKLIEDYKNYNNIENIEYLKFSNKHENGIKFKHLNIIDDKKNEYALAVCAFEKIGKLKFIETEKIL